MLQPCLLVALRVALILAVAVGTGSALAASSQSEGQQRQVQPVGSPPATSVPLGPYYALVIGNNNYQHLDQLQTAVNDATAVAKLLQESYGFVPPTILLNATRSQIIIELNNLRALPENSNLLIYYAGHGTKDPHTNRAYWLPVDAEKTNDVNWISASTITEEISALPSPHILIISDSCYSGEIVRTAKVDINRPDYIRAITESRSRNLMSSGRDEPVADGGKDGHSRFAYVVLESLRRMDEAQFTAADLFQKFIQPWVGGWPGAPEQVPQYSDILSSGHQYGDFVFTRGGAVPGGSQANTGPFPPGPRTDPRTGKGLTFNAARERDAIKNLLALYEQAWNFKDAPGLWIIWPEASPQYRKKVQDSFDQAEAIKMSLQLGIPEFSPDGLSATVKGQFSQVYTPRNESPQPPRNWYSTFSLKKNDGGWTIIDVK
jgi:Caspase domain